MRDRLEGSPLHEVALDLLERVVRSVERERRCAAFGALSFNLHRVLVLHGGLDDGVTRSVHRIGRLLNRPVEEVPAIVAATSPSAHRRRTECPPDGPKSRV